MGGLLIAFGGFILALAATVVYPDEAFFRVIAIVYGACFFGIALVIATGKK